MDVLSLALSKGYTEDSMDGAGYLKGEPGEKGDPGTPGEKGDPGESLNYNWNGTKLGVKKETDTEYEYVDLQGPEGTVDAYSKTEVDNMIQEATNTAVLENCGIRNQFRSINTDFVFDCQVGDIGNMLKERTPNFLTSCYLNNNEITTGSNYRTFFQEQIVEMSCAIKFQQLCIIPCTAKIMPALYNYSGDDPITQWSDQIFYVEYCYALFGAPKRTIVQVILGMVERDWQTNEITNIMLMDGYMETNLIGSYDGITFNNFDSDPSVYTITSDSNNPIYTSSGNLVSDDYYALSEYIGETFDDIIINLCKIHQMEKLDFIRIVDSFKIAFIFNSETGSGPETTYLPIELKRIKMVSANQECYVEYRMDTTDPLRTVTFEITYNTLDGGITANVISSCSDGMSGSL